MIRLPQNKNLSLSPVCETGKLAAFCLLIQWCTCVTLHKEPQRTWWDLPQSARSCKKELAKREIKLQSMATTVLKIWKCASPDTLSTSPQAVFTQHSPIVALERLRRANKIWYAHLRPTALVSRSVCCVCFAARATSKQWQGEHVYDPFDLNCRSLAPPVWVDSLWSAQLSLTLYFWWDILSFSIQKIITERGSADK